MRVIATGQFISNIEGYPGLWHINEIRNIPAEVFERIKHGAPLSDDPRLMADVEHLQVRFERLTQEYRDKLKAQKQKQVRDNQRLAIREEVEKELALEHAKKVSALAEKAKKKLHIGD